MTYRLHIDWKISWKVSSQQYPRDHAPGEFQPRGNNRLWSADGHNTWLAQVISAVSQETIILLFPRWSPFAQPGRLLGNQPHSRRLVQQHVCLCVWPNFLMLLGQWNTRSKHWQYTFYIYAQAFFSFQGRGPIGTFFSTFGRGPLSLAWVELASSGSKGATNSSQPGSVVYV